MKITFIALLIATCFSIFSKSARAEEDTLEIIGFSDREDVGPISEILGKDMSRHYDKYRPRLENVDHAYGRWLLNRYQRRVTAGVALVGISPIPIMLTILSGLKAHELSDQEMDSIAGTFGTMAYGTMVLVTVALSVVSVGTLAGGIVLVAINGPKSEALCEYLHDKIREERSLTNLKITPFALANGGGLALTGSF